jgi:hypothetical protein
MSPKEKHIPDDAHRTSVSFTIEDSTAIHWIRQARRARKDKRATINDVLVDSLWYFLEKVEGVSRDQIRAMVPIVAVDPRPQSKVTEMKPKGKR